MKINLQETIKLQVTMQRFVSIKSDESHMEIFPKASFGNFLCIDRFKILENLKSHAACSHS